MCWTKAKVRTECAQISPKPKLMVRTAGPVFPWCGNVSYGIVSWIFWFLFSNFFRLATGDAQMQACNTHTVHTRVGADLPESLLEHSLCCGQKKICGRKCERRSRTLDYWTEQIMSDDGSWLWFSCFAATLFNRRKTTRLMQFSSFFSYFFVSHFRRWKRHCSMGCDEFSDNIPFLPHLIFSFSRTWIFL